MGHETKKFDFPVGYCNLHSMIIQDFNDFPDYCTLKKCEITEEIE